MVSHESGSKMSDMEYRAIFPMCANCGCGMSVIPKRSFVTVDADAGLFASVEWRCKVCGHIKETLHLVGESLETGDVERITGDQAEPIEMEEYR